MHGYSFIEIIGFGVVLFSGVWGSAFLAVHLKGFKRKLDLGGGSPLMGELREDAQQFEARLGRVEDELRFFRRLNEPAVDAHLHAPDAGSR